MKKVNTKLFMMCGCVNATFPMKVTEEEIRTMKDFKNSDGDYVIGGRFPNLGLFGKHGKIITFYDGDLSWQRNFRGDLN